ncbi:MAG: hypothetical protein J6U54_16840 [Clostridiales bacterium]|nr:hypothetical protein [Clostridiales bacterium]
MANYIIQDTTLTGIANAIRVKDGTSEPILTEDMPTRILAIPSGGGGGMVVPEFVEEKIVDNTDGSGTITFTKDYHNYDMLRVKLKATAYSPQYEDQYCIPDGIDSAFTYSSNTINFNAMGGYPSSNQYCCYSQNGLVWTRTNYRNVNIYEVYGMKFTGPFTKTTIYERKAIANSYVTPTPPAEKTFFDFDAIIYMTCHSNSTETQFGQQLFVKPIVSLIGEKYYAKVTEYNTYRPPLLVTPTSIGSEKYFYVAGLNFT